MMISSHLLDAAPTGLASVAFPLEGSTYWQHCQREHSAVAEHKWFLSEKAGRDVGWSFANWDWVMAGHRARWLEAQRAKNATEG